MSYIRRMPPIPSGDPGMRAQPRPAGPSRALNSQLVQDGTVPATAPLVAPTPRRRPALTALPPQAPGQTYKLLTRTDVDLGTARDSDSALLFELFGNVLVVQRCTFPTDEAEILFDDQGSWVPVGPGSAFYSFPFNRIRVRNAASPGSVMTIVTTTAMPEEMFTIRYR